MITQADLTVLDWIQENLRCGFLDTVTPFITGLAEYGMLWIILALCLMIYPKTRKAGAAVAIALVLELIRCSGILKPLFARPRPYLYRPELELLVPKPWDFSFPSGHAAASFSAACALAAMRQRGWLVALGLSVLIGLTRLYLFVHYPTDVLAGALLGLLCGLAGAFLVSWSCATVEKWKNGPDSSAPEHGQEKTHKS